MNDMYGIAVVNERTTPRVRPEVADFVRREFEPGTGLGYLLAAVLDATQPPVEDGSRVRRALRGFGRRVRTVTHGRARGAHASRPGGTTE